MGAKGLRIRGDVPAAELRRLARREEDRAAAARMQAIAGALEGLSRAEAARLAGMERQALRDAVLRYNAESLAGLCHGNRAGAQKPCEGQANVMPLPPPHAIAPWPPSGRRAACGGRSGGAGR